jgi:hypothetical protein
MTAAGDSGGTSGATAPPAPGHVKYSLLAGRRSTGEAPESSGAGRRRPNRLQLGFTGRRGGRGGARQRGRLGVGSSSGGQPRRGWPAAGRGRAAAAHRLRAGRRRIACVQVCVRGEEERNERWRGSGRVDQAKAGRPGRSGPRWAGQASWASAYWPVNLSPALGEKKKIFI